MYTVAVRRSFIAQHYLIGGDWGRENQRHSHPYQVEIQLSGPELDQHGYLLDITEIERELDAIVERYAEVTLNDLPEFQGINPSIERFAAIIGARVAHVIAADNVRELTVTLWEHENAWAAWRQTL